MRKGTECHIIWWGEPKYGTSNKENYHDEKDEDDIDGERDDQDATIRRQQRNKMATTNTKKTEKAQDENMK